MIIEIENFRIKKSEGINKFDVYQMMTAKTGKNIGKESEHSEAYGVTFKRALEIIAHEVTFNMQATMTLGEYLDRYSEISERIIEKAEKLVN